MDFLATTVISLWVGLMLTGGSAYLAGRYLQRPRLRKAGEIIIGVWLIADFILIVCSFAFDWFP